MVREKERKPRRWDIGRKSNTCFPIVPVEKERVPISRRTRRRRKRLGEIIAGKRTLQLGKRGNGISYPGEPKEQKQAGKGRPRGMLDVHFREWKKRECQNW